MSLPLCRKTLNRKNAFIFLPISPSLLCLFRIFKILVKNIRIYTHIYTYTFVFLVCLCLASSSAAAHLAPLFFSVISEEIFCSWCMTSASELFYNRRLRLGRDDQDLGSYPSSDRSFHKNYNRRHHRHTHRNDLDGGDPFRRPQTARLSPRASHYVSSIHFSHYCCF